MAPKFSVVILCFALGAATGCRSPQDPGPPAEPKDYAHFIVGNPGDIQTPTSPGLLLAGGGADVDEAFDWLIRKSGGGDIVVLRASGGDAYNPYINRLGPVDSVETIITYTREASFSAFVLDRIEKAEALFIAGGNQANYVRLWKNTPLADAVNALARRGVPIGGTSAGLAVMGGFLYPGALGSVVSEEALADPYHRLVILEKDFLDLPHMAGIITDSHFAARDRMGRLLVFLARMIQDGWASSIRGIGIDEATAVVVEGDGSASVLGRGAAYFLRADSSPEVCSAGRPLTYRNIRVDKAGPGAAFHLGTWMGFGGQSYLISAVAGRLESDSGSIY
jgi:cyanophycinase